MASWPQQRIYEGGNPIAGILLDEKTIAGPRHGTEKYKLLESEMTGTC